MIVSYSLGGGAPSINTQLSNLGTLNNVIVFVARNSKDMNNYNDSYAANPSTMEVGYVIMPEATIDNSTTDYKVHFASTQKDWIVPMDSPQSGVMKGDGFSIVGEFATSQSTAFMSAMVANLWTQNPSWTKDQVIAMLKRDTYKSGIYQDNANGWNEMTGYGIAQFGKTMKENIFPEITTQLSSKEGKYYLSVNNWPATYHITGTIVEKDENGYFVDLGKQKPGTYKVIFEGDCSYNGKLYQFPIHRNISISGPAEPVLSNLSASYWWKNNNPQTGLILFTKLQGKLQNYQAGYTVDLIVNGTLIPGITVNTDGTFSLSQLNGYEIPFEGKDLPLTVQYRDLQNQKNWIETTLPLSVLTGSQTFLNSETRVYPNPVSTQLFIEAGQPIKHIELCTLTGQVIRQVAGDLQNSISISLAFLDNGVFLLRVSYPGEKISLHKIVKPGSP